jgi:phosphoglycolate phosphatase
MNHIHDLAMFDLDGTISDPIVGIGRSINYALTHFGHPPLELTDLAVHIGPPLEEAGLPLAVCTSKRVDFAERILKMFGLRSHFRFVNGGEIGIQKWQQVAELRSRGLVTPESVMVGDRAVDLIAAHRNGMHSAAVLWGHGSQAELAGEKPNYMFSTPSELTAFADGFHSRSATSTNQA